MRRVSSFAARILQVLVASFIATTSSFAASITLAWDPNTEPNLAGYRLHYGTAPGTYTQSIDVGNMTTAIIPSLLDGTTYYFVVTAYNTAAQESPWSNEVTQTTAPPANVSPIVSLTAPADGSTYLAPASITLNASAADTDGTVSRVEFYQGTTKLGEDSTSPYSFTWNGVTVGTYTLSARAIDNLGATTVSASVTVNVALPNQAPSISITSPANGSLFTSPANITINTSATDSDGTVTRVEFYNGATRLGESASSPFTFFWNGIPPGNYQITARATDDDGAITNSAIVNVTVRAPNQAPTVAITAPVNGAIIHAPANITMTASAADPDGSIARVEFYRGTIKLGEDISAPYAYTWTAAPAGTYALTAIAVDNENAVTTSSVVNVTVNAPPTVALTTNGTSFPAPASITLTAAPEDSDGTIAKVEFYNGATKLGEATSSPYTFAWGNVAAGNYSLTARATDDRGATSTSAPANVTVTAPNQPPTVAISTSSTPNPPIAPATITIAATASDPDGTIVRVEFYRGSTKLGEDTTSPHSYSWTNVAAGTYSLTAVAIDNTGASTTSAPATVTVQAGSNVVLTTNGTNFNPGSTIVLNASTAQLKERVRRVDFYRGTVQLYRDTKSPYTYSWKSVPAGTYSLTAVATMTSGVIYTSAPVQVTVGTTQLGAMQAVASSYEDPMPTVTPHLQPDGTLNLGITGQYGQTYDVWVSTDLKEWTLMTTVTNLSGSLTVTDSDAPAHKQRFYRVSVQQ